MKLCFTRRMFLLQVIQKPSQESKQTLANKSRKVATAVSDIIHCAELIKGRLFCISYLGESDVMRSLQILSRKILNLYHYEIFAFYQCLAWLSHTCFSISSVKCFIAYMYVHLFEYLFHFH